MDEIKLLFVIDEESIHHEMDIENGCNDNILRLIGAMEKVKLELINCLKESYKIENSSKEE